MDRGTDLALDKLPRAVLLAWAFKDRRTKLGRLRDLGGYSVWAAQPIQRAQGKKVWEWSLGQNRN